MRERRLNSASVGWQTGAIERYRDSSFEGVLRTVLFSVQRSWICCLRVTGLSLHRVIVRARSNIRFKLVKEPNEPRIRIVVAEDHPVVADGIMAVLAKAKDMVVVGRAKNGAEAIELLKQHEPDIALLDLRMPVIDGIDVARWINRSGSNIGTVILTIFDSENDVNQAIQAGANAYLLKDTSASDILTTIRRVHQRKVLVSRGQEQGSMLNLNSVDLKPLELEILALIVQGRDNRTIGSQLGVGTDTLKYYLKRLFTKLGVRKRTAAARQAIERGLVKIH